MDEKKYFFLFDSIWWIFADILICLFVFLLVVIFIAKLQQSKIDKEEEEYSKASTEANN